MNKTSDVTSLAKDALDDVASIASKEAQLARAEFAEGLHKMQAGITEMVVAAAILIPAFTIALIALSYGVAQIDGVSMWGGFAIVAIISGLVGFALLIAGRKSFSVKSFTPSKTAKNIRRDAEAVKEAI